MGPPARAEAAAGDTEPAARTSVCLASVDVHEACAERVPGRPLRQELPAREGGAWLQPSPLTIGSVGPFPLGSVGHDAHGHGRAVREAA